jgi:hypothetical protein
MMTIGGMHTKAMRSIISMTPTLNMTGSAATGKAISGMAGFRGSLSLFGAGLAGAAAMRRRKAKT